MKIKTDKLLHFLSGWVISVTIGLWLPIWGVVIASLVGLGKELIWDKQLGKGDANFFDFMATVTGAFVGFFFAFASTF